MATTTKSKLYTQGPRKSYDSGNTVYKPVYYITKNFEIKKGWIRLHHYYFKTFNRHTFERNTNYWSERKCCEIDIPLVYDLNGKGVRFSPGYNGYLGNWDCHFSFSKERLLSGRTKFYQEVVANTEKKIKEKQLELTKWTKEARRFKKSLKSR